MRQRFVETEKQVASDISFSVEVFRDASIIEISLEGVKHLGHDEANDSDSENAEEDEDEQESHEMSVDDGQESLLTSGKVEDTVMEFFQDVLRSGKLPGGLDYIHAAIKNEKESYLSELESECHSTVASLLIPDILYGESTTLAIGEEVRGALVMYDTLFQKSEKFWLELLDTVFVQAPRVEVIMVPDSTLADTLSSREKKALQDRIDLFGKDALDARGKANEDRIASLRPGSFDSSSFPPIPSTENISRWSYSVSQTESTFFVTQSVKLETDLVHCTIFLDTSDLPISERIFLPLLCDLMLSSDILLADGSRISYTENAKALDRITISTHSGVFVGFSSGLADNCLGIRFAATPNSFEEATKLILLNLFQAEVTAERVAVVSQSLLADSTSSMRDGAESLSSAVMLLPYLEATKRKVGITPCVTFDSFTGNHSIPNFMFDNAIGNHPLLSFLSEEFTRQEGSRSEECQQGTLQRIKSVLDFLRQRPAGKIFVQVTARDPEPAQAALAAHWAKQNNIPKIALTSEKANLYPSAISRRKYPSLRELLSNGTVGRIVGIGGVESTCIKVCVDSEIHEGHADWSAVTVLVEMLSRMEGPLSDAVRASGLAYGTYLTCSSWRGHLSLLIYESSSPTAAWDAVCEVLKTFRHSLDEGSMQSKLRVELDTAKATTLFQINQKRATPGAIMYGAVSRTADGIPASPLADRTIEEKVENVSLEDLARAYDSHICRLLQDRGRLFVVTCGSGTTEEVRRAFQECKNPVAVAQCTIESLYPPFVENVVDSLRTGRKI
ncbi:Metalloenzyme LuxS/M16 peptidase-like protein [Gracilaria domingensis]|nr:Metalloenzyme LuxS/M16 peptidase-like protein [Gracilaria domingensis]